MPGARNLELEAQILDDPEDPAAYLVYADWLESAGDPRGKLITAQAALAAAPGSEALAQAAAAILEEHREALLGPEAGSGSISSEWHYGFWRSAWVGGRPGNPNPADDGEIIHLVASPSARFLRRACCDGPFTPGALAVLAPLARTLRDLEVSVRHDRFEDEHLLALRPFTELRRLALFGCEQITARGMAILSSLRHLEAIDLRNCPLSDDRARCLAGLPLARVKFNVVTSSFTEAGMSVLAAAPLRWLHLDAEAFDDAHVAPLAGHPTLADLELRRARLTASGTRSLGSLPQLRHLYFPYSVLDDRGVRELAPLAGQLRSLHLRRASSVGDAACETLSAFDQLAFLDISCTSITGTGLHMLSRLRRLEHLDLEDADLGDDDVRPLASLANLRSLSLYGCHRITDRAIDTLEQLPLLERLDLGRTGITGHAIARLAALPHLGELGLEACDPLAVEHACTVPGWAVNTSGSIEIFDELSSTL